MNLKKDVQDVYKTLRKIKDLINERIHQLYEFKDLSSTYQFSTNLFIDSMKSQSKFQQSLGVGFGGGGTTWYWQAKSMTMWKCKNPRGTKHHEGQSQRTSLPNIKIYYKVVVTKTRTDKQLNGRKPICTYNIYTWFMRKVTAVQWKGIFFFNIVRGQLAIYTEKKWILTFHHVQN